MNATFSVQTVNFENILCTLLTFMGIDFRSSNNHLSKVLTTCHLLQGMIQKERKNIYSLSLFMKFPDSNKELHSLEPT